MTKIIHKSRSLRRVFKKLPGNKVTIHYEPRAPSKPKCAVCGKPLAGVARVRPYKAQTMAKTQKRPERPYGGNLCSACARERIKREKLGL